MGSRTPGGGVERVAEAVQNKPDRVYAWGPMSTLGLVVALITCAIDQGTKFWLLLPFDIASGGPVHVGPFLDLVLVWNTGISYGLFPMEGPVGQWGLLAFKAAVVVFLWVWLARSATRLTAYSLGLIIGGALGNAFDRLHWPGVMDFALLHLDTANWTLQWYVFNLADAAIVAGVVGLLYESLRGEGAVKAP
jgi:signal peptidase II